MGTNFFARILPTHERKEKLKELIDKDDFDAIQKEVQSMYSTINVYSDEEIIGGTVHLGKRSGGWKFLWDPNTYVIRHGHTECTDHGDGSKRYRFVDEPSTLFYLYPLTKKGIKDFIDREDVVIYDEYGDVQDKDEFFNMALDWTTWRGEEAYDARMYEEKEGERTHPLKSELIDMLEKEGYEFTSSSRSDFYSDGLRFATYVDFG